MKKNDILATVFCCFAIICAIFSIMTVMMGVFFKLLVFNIIAFVVMVIAYFIMRRDGLY